MIRQSPVTRARRAASRAALRAFVLSMHPDSFTDRRAVPVLCAWGRLAQRARALALETTDPTVAIGAARVARDAAEGARRACFRSMYGLRCGC